MITPFVLVRLLNLCLQCGELLQCRLPLNLVMLVHVGEFYRQCQGLKLFNSSTRAKQHMAKITLLQYPLPVTTFKNETVYLYSI